MDIVKKGKVTRTLREYHQEYRISIPKLFVTSLKLKKDDKVIIELLDNKIIIKKDMNSKKNTSS